MSAVIDWALWLPLWALATLANLARDRYQSAHQAGSAVRFRVWCSAYWTLRRMASPLARAYTARR